MNPKDTYIPINFPNIDLLLKSTDLKPDKLRVFLHQLYLSRLRLLGYKDKRKVEEIDESYQAGFVPLSSVLLRRLLTDNYTEYLRLLIESAFISPQASNTSEASYMPGKCRCFRINPTLLHLKGSNQHFRKESITDLCTLKSIVKTKRAFKARNARQIEMKPIDLQLFEMERLVRFKCDEAAECFKDDKLDPNSWMAMHLDLIRSINEGVFDTKVDVFGERLYSPLKRVPRIMRPYMYFDNQPHDELVCLDVRNSQLYFSTLLSHSEVIEEFTPEFRPVIKATIPFSGNADFKEYVSLCIDGTIYDLWQQKRKLRTRDAAKEEIIKLLFCRNNLLLPGTEEFSEYFPSVYRAFRVIKDLKEDALPFITTTYFGDDDKYKDNAYHCNLSCLVQRLESRIFVRLVGGALIESDIQPFFTVHDSIYVSKHSEQDVKRIINDQFKLLGVAPPAIKVSNVK